MIIKIPIIIHILAVQEESKIFHIIQRVYSTEKKVRKKPEGADSFITVSYKYYKPLYQN